MNKEYEILNDFLRNQQKQTISDDNIETISDAIYLSDGSEVGYHVVRVTEDNDGKTTANSMKLYNVLRIDQRKIRNSVIKILGKGILLKNAFDDITSLIIGTILIIFEIEPLLKYQFTDMEAKVLASIYLCENQITNENIITKYNNKFNSEISNEHLITCLDNLQKIKTIIKIEGNLFKINERIIYERKK